MDTVHMLTTVDNPFNPFLQFDEWRACDERLGYHSLGLLARVVITSEDLSDEDQSLAIETAIDEIVSYNVSAMHTKVAAPDGWVD